MASPADTHPQNHLYGSSAYTDKRTKPNTEASPNPKIKVLVCTANIGNEEPNVESIGEWIPIDGDTKSVLENQEYPLRDRPEKSSSPTSSTDHNEEKSESDNNTKHGIDGNEKFQIIAIGMQEATFKSSQNPSFKGLTKNVHKVKSVVDLATKDENHNTNGSFKAMKTIASGFFKKDSTLSIEEKESDDTRALHRMLHSRLPSYTRAVSYQRGQMRLMVFYNEDDISLDVLNVKAQNTGTAGLANKGGIVAECDINSGTRISFLTAHLEAHEGLTKYKTRCSTIADIFKGTPSKLVDFHCDVSMTSHFMFAMGDLNFRTRLPNYEIGSDEHLKAAHDLAAEKNWDTLNAKDELSLALRNKECFSGFSTPRCDFPPTFKVERQDGYSYISKRSPSYTDRILYKANHNLLDRIELQAYEPIDRFTTSDHKPIRGAFEIQLNQSLKLRPVLTKRKNSRRLNMKESNVRTLSGRLLHSSEPVDEPTEDRKYELCNESFSISLSSIRCKLIKKQLTHIPSPCVSVMSTPSDALDAGRNSTINWWKRSYVKINARFRNESSPSTIKWPHTPKVSDTLSPQWKHKIRLKIKTHVKSGAPVDLTGAMIHILVHDTKEKLDVIGSCSLNLAIPIIAARAKARMEASSETQSKSYPSMLAARWKRKNKKKDVIVSSDRPKEPRRRKSIFSREGLQMRRISLFSSNPTEVKPNGDVEKIDYMNFDLPTDVEDGKSNMFSELPARISKLLSSERDGMEQQLVSPSNEADIQSYNSQCQREKSEKNPIFLSKTGDGGHSGNAESQIREEILMKNGREVGTIKFCINTKWRDAYTSDHLSEGQRHLL